MGCVWLGYGRDVSANTCAIMARAGVNRPCPHVGTDEVCGMVAEMRKREEQPLDLFKHRPGPDGNLPRI